MRAKAERPKRVPVRALLVSLLLFTAAPGAAWAAGATITFRDVPVAAERTTATAAPVRFDLVGLHWQGSGTVLFRTRSASGRWSAWQPAAPEAEDLPDVGGGERAGPRGWRVGNPYWTGPSDRLQVRTRGPVRRVRAWFVQSSYARLPLRRVSMAGSPAIVPRAGWAADERLRRGPPVYAPALRLAIVHHTAGSNSYTPEMSAAIVRGIALYHTKANGWKDIGYNFLVDRFGQVFEGRYGGMERNVVGAHAQGFNTGSVGVAVIGTYGSSAPPPAAEKALAELLAWRLDVAHVDPLATVIAASRGNGRYPAGRLVTLRAVSGHRDTGFTACPGNALYADLDAIAGEAARIGLPKLYEPTVKGRIGGSVRFAARLSSRLRWTVTVTRGDGSVAARGSGVGTRVAWTWDASSTPPGRYTWTMEAGPDVTPARGILGRARSPAPPPPPPPPPPPSRPLLSDLAVTPGVVSPNGDGYADTATISYTLSEKSAVTATLSTPDGAVVATLFSDQRQSARRQSFAWPFDGVPDGRYTLAVSARSDSGRTAAQTAEVVVIRTLASVSASPPTFSPDGDGVGDTIAFSFTLAREAHVSIEVRKDGVTLALVFVGVLGPGQQAFLWDGRLPTGTLAAGRYEVAVTAVDAVGTVTQTAAFDVVLGGG